LNDKKIKILVSSNCQTGGLASSLNVFLRNSISSIDVAPLHHINVEVEKLKIAQLLDDVDYWVTSYGWDIPEIKLSCEKNLKLKVIKIPAISFSAFHPDLSYVLDKKSNKSLNGKFTYNSAIAIWLFNNNIDPSKAKYFYNQSTFNILGYKNMWAPSAKRLLDQFISLGFSPAEYHEFFNAIKRTGCFMHSVNHPKITLLFELAKLIASRINPSVKLDKLNTTIADPLMGASIWPVYPDIAYSLGIDGSYLWKLGDAKLINGLDSFILESYSHYENHHERGDLQLHAFHISHDKFNDMMSSLNVKVNH